MKIYILIMTIMISLNGRPNLYKPRTVSQAYLTIEDAALAKYDIEHRRTISNLLWSDLSGNKVKDFMLYEIDKETGTAVKKDIPKIKFEYDKEDTLRFRKPYQYRMLEWKTISIGADSLKYHEDILQ